MMMIVRNKESCCKCLKAKIALKNKYPKNFCSAIGQNSEILSTMSRYMRLDNDEKKILPKSHSDLDIGAEINRYTFYHATHFLYLSHSNLASLFLIHSFAVILRLSLSGPRNIPGISLLGFIYFVVTITPNLGNSHV